MSLTSLGIHGLAEVPSHVVGQLPPPTSILPVIHWNMKRDSLQIIQVYLLNEILNLDSRSAASTAPLLAASSNEGIPTVIPANPTTRASNPKLAPTPANFTAHHHHTKILAWRDELPARGLDST